MGCCPSSSKSELNTSEVISPVESLHRKPSNRLSKRNGSSREENIELVFRAKRANVFTRSINLSASIYAAKKIIKTQKQCQVIRKALTHNYVFSSIEENLILKLIDAMEIVNVSRGDNIITQGQEGDYFYIIESGTFTVIVNQKPVNQLGEGKSFGELALLYNSPRQATIRAETDGVLYSLDRDTFRYTLASSLSSRVQEAKSSLSRVPILSSLTDEQLEKLSDTVAIITYNPGDVIITKGTEGNIFYMIKAGSVKISDAGKSLNDEFILSAGDYFGERALITGEPRAATVTAITKTIVMALDRENFNNLLGPLREVIDQNTNMQVLSTIKLFDRLTKAEKLKIAKSFVYETFKANTVIIKEGDKGSKFYILKDGLAKVTVKGSEVGELKSGQYFGEMALLDDDVRKASVVAQVDCECFVLDRPTFSKIMSSLQQIIGPETNSRMEALKLVTTSASNGQVDDNSQFTNYKLADFQAIGILGLGTFGRVTLIQHKQTNQTIFALKTMLKSDIVQHQQQVNILTEKTIMKSCNHPFIAKLYQTFRDSSKLYMLLEFVQGGELFSVLHTPQNDGVPDNHAKFYGGCILLALSYLHSLNVAYRDLKPENCLIDKQGYTKIIDFGFAKIIKGKSYTLCGTPEYLAPELVLARGHNQAVDYWSFGILLYEMEAGYSPFSDPQGMDQVVICRNIVNGKLIFPRNFNADCKDLVKRLLAREVQNRLGNLRGGTDDIKNHKWFHGFDFDSVLRKKIKAPWIPKLSGPTDTSNFDPYEAEELRDPGPADYGNWDKDF